MIKKLVQYLFSPPYWRFLYFLQRAKYTGRYKTARASFSGFKIEVADMLSFAWQYWEIFLKDCYAFESSSTHPVIIDCGGNIGVSALYFAKLYPQAIIKVIEADKSIAALCNRNLVANHHGNIEVINKAAWTYNGHISFFSEGADGGRVTSDPAGQVECMDFNEFLQPFTYIDMLKIDIEGAEAAILEHSAGQLKKIKYLFIEYHSSPSVPQQLGNILNLLTQNGFRYYMEDLQKKHKPFLTQPANDHFDLQLNIYATNKQL